MSTRFTNPCISFPPCGYVTLIHRPRPLTPVLLLSVYIYFPARWSAGEVPPRSTALGELNVQGPVAGQNIPTASNRQGQTDQWFGLRSNFSNTDARTVTSPVCFGFCAQIFGAEIPDTFALACCTLFYHRLLARRQSTYSSGSRSHLPPKESPAALHEIWKPPSPLGDVNVHQTGLYPSG